MEFDCTKEGKNIYFACREKAAKYNDLLNSRERAAELLGISTSTLANHELGVTKNVPPDTVVMMSDLYKTPELRRHSKNGKVAKSYLAEAASVTKMMKGILHNTAQMEARKSGSSYELSEIVHYIRENDLISDEKLDELRKTARERAKIRNEENQKEIDRIYGKYRGGYIPSNNTKSDKTAEKAIKNVGKKG